jgi:hypothetical protein
MNNCPDFDSCWRIYYALCDDMFCFEIKLLLHCYVAIQPYLGTRIYCQPLGSNEETEDKTENRV